MRLRTPSIAGTPGRTRCPASSAKRLRARLSVERKFSYFLMRTVHDDDAAMSEPILMKGLRVKHRLPEKRTHRRRLIKSHDAVVCAHFLQRPQHGGLVASCPGSVMSSSRTGTRPPEHAPEFFACLSSSSLLWCGSGNEFETSRVPSMSRPRRRPCTMGECASELCLMIFETTFQCASGGERASEP